MNRSFPNDKCAALKGTVVALIVTAAVWCCPQRASPEEMEEMEASGGRYETLRDALVDQRGFGEMACGPCAMYHSLLFGGPLAREILTALPGVSPDAKLDHLIQKYGSRPSSMRVGEPMLHARGLHWQDAGLWMNAILQDHGGPALTSGYFQREEGADHQTHLRKVHRLLADSLEAGWPPVISLRGYVARHDSRLGGIVWQAGQSHYVTLVELGALDLPEDSGFMFRYIESSPAGRRQGFVHIERQRDFQAQTTTEPLGLWMGDAPFLVVTVPFMRLIDHETPLHLRSVVTLHHAILHRQEDNDGSAAGGTRSEGQ